MSVYQLNVTSVSSDFSKAQSHKEDWQLNEMHIIDGHRNGC